MEFSIKTKLSIIRNLNSILNKEFAESNIKELLIDLRELIPELQILREVADFIAHPIRDRGLCHSDIDLVYAQLKFILPKENPLRFDVNKIPKKLFETLILKGIEKVNSAILYSHTSLTQENFIRIIKTNYKIRNNFALLEKRKNFDEMIRGINFLLSNVNIKSVFNQEDFINELKTALSDIQLYVGLSDEHIVAVEENANDIMVCIIALLHDGKVTLFDNSVGRLQISLIPDPVKEEKGLFGQLNIGLFIKMEIEKNSFVDISFCIMESKGTVDDYISGFTFKEYFLMEIVTRRVEGKLQFFLI